ncbi:protealysin inhibitor emfourin [Actinoplanes sp. NPDC049118]|uniref:protealysin inhibitor emfourin n=1 Tax=Actinoplanes sp. NPDC049118 TaxID=3155769 RepID=UPI0033CEC845
MEPTITRRGAIALAAACAVAALTPAAPAAAAPAPAVAIVLERTGGFAGTRDTFVVDRSTAEGRRPLRMAASPAFRGLRGSYQPANSCCDRYFYRLTVTYRGGRHKTVSTVQGTTAPSILWRVIADVERVGARHVPAHGDAVPLHGR